MYQESLEHVDRISVVARGEAARLGHDYIGTEHLLLALLRLDDPELNVILERSGVTPQRIAESLELTLRPGRSGADFPLTSRANTVLNLSMAESRSDGSSAPRPVHLFGGQVLRPPPLRPRPNSCQPAH